MERILLRNGTPEPAARTESVYLYQTLHVRGRRPLWLDHHAELLTCGARELFGLRWTPDLARLEAQIVTLLDANRHPTIRSSFVRLALTPAGDLLLIPGAVSLYDGYALRSLRPVAAVANYGVPYPDYPTSAREAAYLLALQAAVAAGNQAIEQPAAHAAKQSKRPAGRQAQDSTVDLLSVPTETATTHPDAAWTVTPARRSLASPDTKRTAARPDVQAMIRCDGDGFVHACDEAPLFAVKGKKVYTPPAPPSVEGELARRAIEAARLHLQEQQIARDQLPRFDELFYVDHRGVTSIAACEGRLYAEIVTERIARTLNKLY